MAVPIVDTHQHLILPELMPYAWTRGIPQLESGPLAEGEYARASEGLGITRTIFMETTPDAWRRETQSVYARADRAGSAIAGVIANCRPEEKDGFDAYVESIRHPKLVGLRRICHVEPDDFSQQPHFVQNVRRLARHGLTFDLCFLARQLPLATTLAQQCPNVQFVLDHCGRPDIAAVALDPWRDDLRTIAALPNVACKISGVVTQCRPGDVTADAIRPYVEHCIDCFGWGRVVWGGDWPVCNMASTLREWVAISREIVRGASDSEQRRLFAGNATRVYGIGETA